MKKKDKMQLQNIPWKDVPIPQPQMNVKIVGENRNQQKKAFKKAKKMMQMNTQCKDENCNDCESNESATEENAKSEIKNMCTYCNKESKFMICNECTRNGNGIKLNIEKS